jgi:hypothetical protein
MRVQVGEREVGVVECRQVRVGIQVGLAEHQRHRLTGGVFGDERRVRPVGPRLDWGQWSGPGAVGAHGGVDMLEAGEIGADQIEVHQLRLVRLKRGDRLAVRTEDAELERGRLTGR